MDIDCGFNISKSAAFRNRFFSVRSQSLRLNRICSFSATIYFSPTLSNICVRNPRPRVNDVGRLSVDTFTGSVLLTSVRRIVYRRGKKEGKEMCLSNISSRAWLSRFLMIIVFLIVISEAELGISTPGENITTTPPSQYDFFFLTK